MAFKGFLDPRHGRGFVLALDIAWHLGWASLREDGSVASGEVVLRDSALDGVGYPLIKLRHMLKDYLDGMPQGTTGVIAIEELTFTPNGGDWYRQWAMLVGNVESWAYLHDIPVYYYTVQDVKKAATGHGDAPKNEAHRAQVNKKRAARERPIKPYTGPTVEQGLHAKGFTFETDNEADALACLLAHLIHVDGVSTFLARAA